MGPQGKATSRFAMIPDLDHHAAVKERLISGSGSVSGSPGRIHDNISRDSGIGCLKVINLPSCRHGLNVVDWRSVEMFIERNPEEGLQTEKSHNIDFPLSRSR